LTLAILDPVARWFASRPTHTRVLLTLAITVLVLELLLRNLGPRSALYARWTAAFLAIGKVWTFVILTFLYVIAIGPVGLFFRLTGKDPLERGLEPAPSFWHQHEPNPLGVRAAARYQF
jgi:hypothetical protein